MMQNLSEDNFNRLSISIMEKFNCSYEEALNKLSNMTLRICCGEKIKTSLAFQAALVTAVSTGKRAFLGGVDVVLPNTEIPCLLPIGRGVNLDELIAAYGACTVNNTTNQYSFTLSIDLPSDISNNSLEIICNSWQAGVTHSEFNTQLEENNFLPLGGIAAGSIGVGLAFLLASGIDKRCADLPVGISLWRPDLNWLDDNAVGEEIFALPKQAWILGLGHLGQAYIWNLSMLPFEDSSKVKIVLQDFDEIVEANFSAGVLAEKENIGKKKTRVCSQWLENFGFETAIIEKKFDQYTKVEAEEPYVALCGFDNALARTYLEDAGFDLIIEAGLGSGLSSFDEIIVHTFPNAEKSPKDIWENEVYSKSTLNSVVLERMKDYAQEECGVLPIVLAKKAISSSFVGVLAGAQVVSELVRAANCNTRYEYISTRVRNLKRQKAFPLNLYSSEIARNGFLEFNNRI